MFFIAGRYTIQTLSNGSHTITYAEDGLQRSVNTTGLVGAIEGLIASHRASLGALRRLLDDFDTLAPEELASLPTFKAIHAALPSPLIPPGETYQGDRLIEWHHQALLSAYNDTYGTTLTLAEVR